MAEIQEDEQTTLETILDRMNEVLPGCTPHAAYALGALSAAAISRNRVPSFRVISEITDSIGIRTAMQIVEKEVLRWNR